MGLILDSSVLIAAERRGLRAGEVLGEIGLHFRGELVGVSVVTLLELAHGVARTNPPSRKAKRQLFLSDLMSGLRVYPVTSEIALRAGELDGIGALGGVRPALADLLIGVTALDLGFAVATGNVRHFEMIPGLQVVRF